MNDNHARSIAMRAEFEGTEGPVVADIEPSGQNIKTIHGFTLLSWEEWDHVAAEVAAYRRAIEAAGDARAFPKLASRPVTLHQEIGR